MRNFFGIEGEFLILSLQSYIESGQAFTRVKVFCENMDLAADVVQDMAKYFKWEELESEAEFAAEFEKFEQVCCLLALCNFHSEPAGFLGLENGCRL